MILLISIIIGLALYVLSKGFKRAGEFLENLSDEYTDEQYNAKFRDRMAWEHEERSRNKHAIRRASKYSPKTTTESYKDAVDKEIEKLTK